MASTFSLKSHSWGGRYLLLECTQTKDIANNKSPVSWKLSSIGGEVNFYTTDVTLTINGTDVYKSGRTEWDTERFPAAKGSTSGTIDVPHDEYGNKTIEVVMTVMIYDGVWRTHKGSWELDNIPRQANITDAPDFTDNDNPTITYNNPAGDSVDDLQACISWTGAADIAYKPILKTGKSFKFEFTEAERDALRNAAPTGTRDVTFYIRTIIGANTFYSTLPKKLTIQETDKTKPVVSMSITLDNGSLPSEFDGLWIQGKSRAYIEVAAEGKYGASISGIVAQIGKTAYNYLKPFTSNVIDGIGKVGITATATDTRGFIGTDTEEINVIGYSKPLVVPIGIENAIQCYRSDGNGKRVGNSTSLWVKAKRFYYSVNNLNQCSLQWRRKLSTDTWDDNVHKWYDLISKDTTNTDEYNALLPSTSNPSDTDFDTRKSYTVQIRAMDDVGEYDIKTFDVPTQDVALHLGRGGKNVTIGTYCDYDEEYTFRSVWKAIFDEGFVDGTDTGWIALNDYTSYRCKCGYVTVVVWCGGDLVLTPNAYTVVATLPEGYRPALQIPFTYHTQGGSPPSQSAYIGVDGNILVYTAAENSDYFAFTVTYPI